MEVKFRRYLKLDKHVFTIAYDDKILHLEIFYQILSS